MNNELNEEIGAWDCGGGRSILVLRGLKNKVPDTSASNGVILIRSPKLVVPLTFNPPNDPIDPIDPIPIGGMLPNDPSEPILLILSRLNGCEIGGNDGNDGNDDNEDNEDDKDGGKVR